jgi:hypothetical protein
MRIPEMDQIAETLGIDVKPWSLRPIVAAPAFPYPAGNHPQPGEKL